MADENQPRLDARRLAPDAYKIIKGDHLLKLKILRPAALPTPQKPISEMTREEYEEFKRLTRKALTTDRKR
jgi:hypothetical protein